MPLTYNFKVPKSNTGVFTIAVGAGGGGGTSFGDINNVPPQKIVDHQITGQTIFAEYILPPNYLGLKESEIKKLLIEKLVQEMYKVNNQHNIEFTQMRKVDTDEMVYRARIHVVPDTQVRIIRELKDA